MRYMISFQCESNEEAQAVLQAVATIGKTPHACSKQYVEAEEVKPVTEYKNVSPGIPSIGKIGTNTKEELLNLLAKNVQPAEKYAEHLKLLWSRGEIKYDGTSYYI